MDVYKLLANLTYRIPKEAAGSIVIPETVLTHAQVDEVMYALQMAGVLNEPPCPHYWKVMKHLVTYSPSSYRYCSDCGLVQGLTYKGWMDWCMMTDEVSAV